ncbi:hypothetical protein OZ410_10550 [Robiginitalea sp. M366]|uniref:hypothetical protein n=1 Tax=Robiginitalea aestuariiviva TaxID=3036903 RepID=UPI00240D95C3|nr:hypothetical protein [Robiginitalea aestuariiviva]MDG1572756.1 hypothetical protein [Robiginitalea aestuariiviva]
MKKLFFVLMLGSMAFYSCDKQETADESINGVNAQASVELQWSYDGCSGESFNLIAGQNTVVGTVSVSEEAGMYTVTYEITEGDWAIVEWHLQVEEDPQDFPHNQSGNPKIGNFEFYGEEDGATSVTVQVPASEGTWFAAHAVVDCGAPSTPEEFVAALPETVDFCTSAQGPTAYLNISVDGGLLTGDYGAWCIDNDKSITLNSCHEGAAVYASTEELPEGLFEYPENFDLVNYLLNQGIVGTDSPNGLGTYTYGDLQFAIWYLIDDVENADGSGYSLGAFDAGRVQELVAMATANGEGFTPGCGDLVGVALIPNENVQPLLVPVPIECSDCEETAWAEGCDFPGNSWAMYFQFDDGND